MRNTFFKLWIHGILKTCPDRVLIDSEKAELLYLEIEKKLMEQGCEVAIVNGRPDHVHFLFLLNPLLSLHETIRFLQGVTQRWYHLRDFNTAFLKFKWEDGYCAYSVSESAFDKVKFFIEKQAIIHQEIGFEEERERLNLLHNVDISDESKEKELRTSQPKYTFNHIGSEWVL